MIAARRWFPDTVQPVSHWSSKLPASHARSQQTRSVLVRRRESQIYRGQHREYVRLHDGHENVQP